MKKYEVWNEGYRATGEYGTAQYLGEYEANSFKEAIIKALKHKEWDMNFFNEEKLTYWGCSFYDSEEKAREAFG